MKKERYFTELLDFSESVFLLRRKYYFLALSALLLFSGTIFAEETAVDEEIKHPEKPAEKNISETGQISLEQAEKLLKGKFKEVAEELKGEKSGKDLTDLYHLNILVLDFYKDKVGTEATLPIKGKNETGIITKIKRGTLYFKVKKPKITAVWPLKIKKFPMDFKMKLIGIPEYLQNLYYGVKEFKRKNYAAAKYFLVRTGGWREKILEAADKESKYIMALAGACVKGNTEEIKELIKKGADVNGDVVAYVKTKGDTVETRHISTPLIESIKCLKTEVIKLLVKNGADVNKSNSNGVTPLMFAIMYFPQNMDIINFLLDNGADLDAFDKSGNTPLCGAVAAGRPGAVQLLLERGAEINAPNRKGFTPVMLAVISNKPGIFKLLVDKGANLKKRHPGGWTLFELDRRKMDADIRKFLDKVSPRKEQSIPTGVPGLSGMRIKEKE